MKRLLIALCIALQGLLGWSQEKDVRHWSVAADFGMTTGCDEGFAKYWQIDAKAAYRMNIYDIFVFQPEVGINFRNHDKEHLIATVHPGVEQAGLGKTSDKYARTAGVNLNALVGLSFGVNTTLIKRVDVLTGPVFDWDIIRSSNDGYNNNYIKDFKNVFLDWHFGVGIGVSRHMSINAGYNLKLANKDYNSNTWTVGLSYHFRP